jgi:predicted short-subunit dehydrogenase-like oxidoreductase (DUF2520 family)
MHITIIGTGNVATVLGKILKVNNHHINAVVGRNTEHVQQLSQLLNAQPMNLQRFQPVPETDLYLIAVSDNAIQETIMHLQFGNTPVVHTAGSVSKDILQASAVNYGVFYPLQSLTKDMQPIPEIPLLVDANSEPMCEMLMSLGKSLSGKVYLADDNVRLKLHVAAVVVNNFTNHLFCLAEQFCQTEKVPFDLLKPLIMETAQRIQHTSPAFVQTGPAKRKDITTLDKHLRILNTHPALRTMYLRLTDSIMNP